jgi:hypothetical protein
MNCSGPAVWALIESAFQTERASNEHLAELLTLSFEPMLAWKLDGPIEFWIPEPSGFMDSLLTKR